MPNERAADALSARTCSHCEVGNSTLAGPTIKNSADVAEHFALGFGYKNALGMRDLAPDFFLPFCYVNPMFPDESVAEIRRCVAGEGSGRLPYSVFVPKNLTKISKRHNFWER